MKAMVLRLRSCSGDTSATATQCTNEIAATKSAGPCLTRAADSEPRRCATTSIAFALGSFSLHRVPEEVVSERASPCNFKYSAARVV